MHSYRTRQFVIGICIVAMTMLTGCAGTKPAAPKEQRAATDPWEPLNRRIHNFNTGFDKVTFKPLAKGYEKIIPGFARKGIGNFSTNLLGRFVANTIFGIGGLFDAAGRVGVESYPESFGETFAVWGIPDGPFVVIPVLGPRTVTSAFGIPFNFLADPLFHVDDNSTKWIIYGIRAIDLRQRLFAAEILTEDSFDRYLTIRESYLQNRQFRIYDGDPPVDEDFYDEFLEEE